MRDDLTSMIFPVHGEPIDPVAMARKDMQKKLPKRFYADVTTELRDGVHVLLLDGRPARTPARNLIGVEAAGLADILAKEWQAQVEVINPLSMPLTRLVHSALDGVAHEMEAVRAELHRYAASDLICYRAANPQALVDEQARHWDPVLDFAARELGARFTLAQGVMFAAQPEPALAAVGAVLSGFEKPLQLAALHVLTSISGSVLIALAVARGFITAEQAFEAAHVDEHFQARVWGADEEAAQRLAQRKVDFLASAAALAGANVA